MSTIHLTSQNFDEIVLQDKKPVLVDFWASWCAPCRMFAPIFEKTSEKFEGTAIFAKLNVDEAQDIAINYSVVSIPTVVLFKNGKEVARRTGAISAGEIANLLKS